MSDIEEEGSGLIGHFEVEVVIERAAAEVWKQYLDHGSWITSHSVEHVRGRPDTVGSITRVSFKRAKELGLAEPHYHHCKVIELVPERRSIIRGYTPEGGAYGMNFKAFDDMRFIPEGNRTRVVFNLFMEAWGEAIVKDPSAAQLDASRKGMIENLNRLKRLVEDDRGDHSP